MLNMRAAAPSSPNARSRADARMTVEQVNRLDHEAFVATFGPVYEGSPWIAVEAWNDRPFVDLDHLHRAMSRVVERAASARQEALIRAHPDLVGEAARAGTLTRASADEQATAGLDRLSPSDIADFDRFNRAYRDRFGFPFVVCARENKKETILAGFALRLGNNREEEVAAALREIAKIARYRLGDLVESVAFDEPPATPQSASQIPTRENDDNVYRTEG